MKNFFFFERTVYTVPLDKSFYRFCLIRQPALIKYFFVRFLMGFLYLIGAISAERYNNKRWNFLKSVSDLDVKTKKYWSLSRHKIHNILNEDDNLWISLYPEPIMKHLAEKHETELFANSFDLNEGRFDSYKNFEELYRMAARTVKPNLVIDAPHLEVKTGVETLYIYNGKAFYSRAACRSHQIMVLTYTILMLLFMGIGLGIISMYFGASNMLLQMFLSYFSIPLLPVLNILPVVLLVFLMYFILNRAWLSFLISSVFLMVLTWINYFKLIFRNDPLLASDFALISETDNMLQKYTINLNWKIIVAIILCIAVVLGAYFLVRTRLKSPRIRLCGMLVLVCVSVFCYMTVYTSPAVYAMTENLSQINRWSATQQYISRGFVYPFLYSVKSASIKPPEGYDEKEAEEELLKYTYDNIPENEKVTVVAVMLEAFNDFSKFDEIEFSEDIYAPWHELQEKSYSGELVTNIFAGGTVDTEWSFLTGYSKMNDFRVDANSYVRYFKEQGYFAQGSHPCYSWFYNRLNVNQYLGFDNYYFYENKYFDMSGGIAGDDILFPEILSLYEEHINNQDTPYFSFNVTYQNHGPYRSDVSVFEKEYVVDNNYSEQTRNILNNYFGGIADTAQRVAYMAEYFENRSDPVVFIVFGDHNPWLGDGNSVYKELGISFNFDLDEGFKNYYSTPYIIFANDAAKQALGNDIEGKGEDISPCFLMNELFELAGWGGNEYMKLSSDVKATTPLVHKNGVYSFDGILASTIPEASRDILSKYEKLQYYWRWNLKPTK